MLTRFQQAVLKFLRKRELSAAQMFLMWRHYPDPESCASVPDLAHISPRAFKALPRAPETSAIFSLDETVTILRLVNLQGIPYRYKAWSLVNRCVWERLFPEEFSRKVAGSILREANDADNLSLWVTESMQPRSPYYEAALDLMIVDVSRATNSMSVSEEDFQNFLRWKSAATPVDTPAPTFGETKC